MGLREKGWQDVRSLLNKSGKGENECGGNKERRMGKRRKLSGEENSETPKEGDTSQLQTEKKATTNDSQTAPASAPTREKQKKIFDGLCVYINGSTAPLVGDHRLKQLLAENGARVSIALGRRTVTHVVLGTPNGAASGGKGAGGGLAATKIQKEIMTVGGKGVKYVGVEWVLESLKAAKRLPEAQFSNLSLAAKGQKSVYGIFSREQKKNLLPEAQKDPPDRSDAVAKPVSS
ncbi:MAG: hypothetical protein Q9223_005642 [Gallowayella weberi]